MTPSWLPDQRIVIAQLAGGVLEHAQQIAARTAFRLPYPSNLQFALDNLTLLAWHQEVTPPTDVVDLLRLAAEPFGDWEIDTADGDVDPDEALLSLGRPTPACEELGSLRGDIEGEIRENTLMRSVMDRTRAAGTPRAYVAFRRLLIEHPSLTALDLDLRLADPDLSVVAGELRDAYPEAPLEAASDGLFRTCGGCQGLLMPAEDDRSWICEDDTCPTPGTPGLSHPASEGMHRLRRELRTFITGPGRAELRIAKAVERHGVPVELWPDFDACDLRVFADRPWIVDVKAWRNPARLARSLRERLFRVPPGTDRAFIVIGHEQTRAHPGYLDRLHRACPDVRPGGRIVAVSEKDFLTLVRHEVNRRSETNT